MSDLSLRICGVKILLGVEDESLAREARERYAPFLKKGIPDLTLEAVRVWRPMGKVTWAEPAVRRVGKRIHVRRHDLEADFGPGVGRARVYHGVSRLDSFLRIALSFELLNRDGFLCHAAGVDGWLFPGRSGAGKSTLGLSAPPKRLLADELTAVIGDRLWGTPFWGDFRAGRNDRSCPLEAVFLLDRRAARGIRPVPKVRALSRILECAMCFGNDIATGRRLLDLARRCVERVPTFVVSYDARKTGFAELERKLRKAIG